MENIKNIYGSNNSLQVSYISDIAAGTLDLSTPFLIKNITDNNITATIKLVSGSTVSTVLYPGWNPELCQAITSAVEANTLQYGY